MKCQKLFHKIGTTGWAHLLICSECRKHRRADQAIEAAAARLRATGILPASSTLVEAMLSSGSDLAGAAPVRKPFLALGTASAGAVCIFVLAVCVRQSHRPSVASKAAAKFVNHEVVPPPNIIRNSGIRASSRRRRLRGWSLLPGPFKPTANAIYDSEFLNPGRDGSAIAIGSSSHASTTAPIAMMDDFVVPAPVSLAVNDNALTVEEMSDEATKRYAQEAKVVDTRLFRNVNLALKHASFAKVCQELERQTGVQMTAGRNIVDGNGTLFVTVRPAREVMREISRVFGVVWELTGHDGAYSYRLTQEISAQVAEEKLRNDDVSKSLEALSKAMTSPKPNVTGVGFRTSAGDVRQGPGVDVGQATFRNLSLEELDILRSGRKLTLGSPGLPAADSRVHLDGELDPDLATQLLRSGGTRLEDGHWAAFGDTSFSGLTTYDQLPGSGAGVTLQLRVSEFGGVELNADVLIAARAPDGSLLHAGGPTSLGDVPGPAEDPLDNARDNAKEKTTPGFSDLVQLTPKPTTPLRDQGIDPGPIPPGSMLQFQGTYRTFPSLQPPRPFMTSDDFWQAVHETTKRDVVADSFSRLFPLKRYSGSLFEVLSKGCDAMHYHWKLDERFLTGRSEAYQWQRLNEVPTRYLEQWQAKRKVQGWLPLEGVLAMAMMDDRQLDAVEVGRTIANQWDLPEWGIPSRPHKPKLMEMVRPICRFLANLPLPLLNEAVEGTLTVGEVPTDLAAMIPMVLKYVPNSARLRVDYVPPGQYYWSPVFIHGKEPIRDDLIFGPTGEAVMEEVRRRYPDRTKEETSLSDGLMALLRSGVGPSAYLPSEDMGDARFSVKEPR